MRLVVILGLTVALLGIAPVARADFWAKERADGTVEFTNVPPVGAGWKVLFKTGPGKAKATRGATDIRPPRDASPERLHRYDEHIRDQFGWYFIPEQLLRAVIKTESDYDPNVISSAGAKGLMQLMPATAHSMGVVDIFDARQNIFGGARYLATLAQRYCRTPVRSRPDMGCSRAELIKIIAAYHAGPGAVDKYGGLPPYETTRAYVSTVLRRFQEYTTDEQRMLAER